MNRRGFIMDVPVILIVVFSVALTFLVMAFILSLITTALTAEDIDPIAEEILTNGNDAYPLIADGLVSFLAIGAPLVAAGLAFLIDMSAIFFWLLISSSVFWVLLGAALGNVWETVTGASLEFTLISQNMVITNWIMTHYAIYALFVFVVVMGGLYFRMRRTA